MLHRNRGRGPAAQATAGPALATGLLLTLWVYAMSFGGTAEPRLAPPALVRAEVDRRGAAWEHPRATDSRRLTRFHTDGSAAGQRVASGPRHRFAENPGRLWLSFAASPPSQGSNLLAKLSEIDLRLELSQMSAVQFRNRPWPVSNSTTTGLR